MPQLMRGQSKEGFEMKAYKDGWYRVTLENQNPDKDEVERFDEWVELINGAWDYLRDYPKCLVVEVIRAE
jgi:hypothetical protein